MRMVLNSVQMLREYNREIRVHCVLVLDRASHTLRRETIHPGRAGDTEQFRRICAQNKVVLHERAPIELPGDEGFFHTNRIYLADLPEEDLLFIDADTFIFGDVARFFEDYPDDLTGCVADWAYGKGWEPDFLKIRPLSSGVLLWRDHGIRRWAEGAPRYFRDLRNGVGTVGRWLNRVQPDCSLREECSVSLHASETGMKVGYFKKSDVHLILHEEDFAQIGKATVFHSYAPHWKRVFHQLHGLGGLKRVSKHTR